MLFNSLVQTFQGIWIKAYLKTGTSASGAFSKTHFFLVAEVMLTASQNTFLYFQSMWSSLLQFQQCFHFRKDLQLNPIPFITQPLLIHVISFFLLLFA